MVKKIRKGRLSLGAGLEQECELNEISPSQEVDSRQDVVRQSEMQAAAPSSNLSKDQISDYIKNCVKLSQDNKINLRNAFDVNLIDYFSTLTDTDEGPNFSLASMSLDASSKIYGLRVDSVYQDMVRLASGFGVNKNNNNGEAGDTENVEEVGDVTKVAKKSKRRVRSTYVSQDEGQINGDLDVDYDMVGNDILTRVHQNDGNPLGRIISYSIVPYDDQVVTDLEGTRLCLRPMEDVPTDLTLPPVAFNFEAKVLSILDNMNLNETLQGFDGDVAMANDELNNSVVFDPLAEPLPVPEEAAEAMEDVENGTMAGDAFDMSMPNSMFTSMAESTKMISGMAFNDLNTSFLKKFIPSSVNMAGPMNFRMKKFSILGVEKGRRKPVSKRAELEYISRADDANMEAFLQLTSASAKSKKKGNVNVLLLSSREKWSSDSTCLRVDIDPDVTIRKHASLFTLPTRLTRISRHKPAHDNEEDSQMNFFDDPDNRPVSPGADINLSDEVGCDAERNFQLDHIEEVENDFAIGSQPNDQDEADYNNLITAPGIQANRLTIGYTKAARKFNVRQMKSSMWKVLVHDETDDVEEAPKETEAVAMEGSKRFSELYDEIQPHLNATNKKNVTVPLAFLSMLMLCNERHLRLAPVTSGNPEVDFLVVQAPEPQDE